MATLGSHSVIPSPAQQGDNYRGQNDKPFCVTLKLYNKSNISFVKLTLTNEYNRYNVATIDSLYLTPLSVQYLLIFLESGSLGGHEELCVDPFPQKNIHLHILHATLRAGGSH